jgi:hypothetical protein
MAQNAGGETPKEVPYGRLTSFNATARFSLAIKRDGKTAYLWVTDQDVAGLKEPVLVYDADRLELEASGPRNAADYFKIQRLNSGTWTDVTNIGLANFIRKRNVVLTITGTAATSTITVSG